MTADLLDAARLAAFDPAAYPCRIMVSPEGMRPDAVVSVCWLPSPFAEATLHGMLQTLAAGGGIFLMAPDRAELVRMREEVELLLSAAAEL